MSEITDLQAKVAQLETQQAMTIEAIHDFVEGRLNGPNSVVWQLAAISPGLVTTPAPFGFDPQ